MVHHIQTTPPIWGSGSLKPNNITKLHVGNPPWMNILVPKQNLTTKLGANASPIVNQLNVILQNLNQM
jgi:hypothetical protein